MTANEKQLQAIDDLLVSIISRMPDEQRDGVLDGREENYHPEIERALAVLAEGRPNGPMTVSLWKAIRSRGLLP